MGKLETETEDTLMQKSKAIDEKVKSLETDRAREAQKAKERFELIERKLKAALQFHEDQKRQMLRDADNRLANLNDQYSKRLGQEQDKISRIQRDVDIGRANRAKHLQEIEATYKRKFDGICNMLKLDGMKFETALSATELEAEQELRTLQTNQRRKLQQSSEKSAEAYTAVEKHKAEVQKLQQTLKRVETDL